MITQELLRRLWPHARPALIAAIAEQAPILFPKFGLTTARDVAHAMAQFSHECGADTEGVENLNYSAAGLIKTWPTRFNKITAAAYAHQPRMIANSVYNGRMGNRPGTDDGWNYRGRGGSQVTGHDGYYKLAVKSALDLMANPDKVNEPEHWLLCAVVDLILCGCLPFIKRDDIRGVTHHLNGGYIGLAERRAWFVKWKAALGADEPESAPASDSPLKYGDHGWQVEAVQRRLNALNYQVGKADGDFGATTRAALLAFQADRGLPTTGIVDQETKDSLAGGPPRPVAEARATASEADLKEAGSETVDNGSTVSLIGKGAAGIGGVEAANKAGLFDTVKDSVEQVSELKDVAESAHTVFEWVSAHWWIGAIVIGFAAWYFGRKIIRNKLARYRAGHAMER